MLKHFPPPLQSVQSFGFFVSRILHPSQQTHYAKECLYIAVAQKCSLQNNKLKFSIFMRSSCSLSYDHEFKLKQNLLYLFKESWINLWDVLDFLDCHFSTILICRFGSFTDGLSYNKRGISVRWKVAFWIWPNQFLESLFDLMNLTSWKMPKDSTPWKESFGIVPNYFYDLNQRPS